MNAMNINNKTPINDKIAILIGVYNYAKDSKELANIHKNHCIAAYKIDDTLYCLDPWGKDTKNISLSIFYQLQKITKCKNIFIYQGKNLQQFDKTGVCVGLSSNFLMNMGKRKQKIGFETKDIPVNRKEYSRLLKKSRYDDNIKKISSLWNVFHPTRSDGCVGTGCATPFHRQYKINVRNTLK